VRVPDVAGPILGWRVWRVSEQASGDIRLRSVLYDEIWEPRRELVAACEHGHTAPDDGCSCGIHAARDPATVGRYLVGRNDPSDVHRVIGQVALWGWVCEGDAGWRASRAYPARIRVPTRRPDGTNPTIDEIAVELAAYGVPLESV
jgi:hypothetical protein